MQKLSKCQDSSALPTCLVYVAYGFKINTSDIHMDPLTHMHTMSLTCCPADLLNYILLRLLTSFWGHHTYSYSKNGLIL